MARPLRIEYAGAHYHVINRGNAREKIFRSDGDREKFLAYIQRAVERFSIVVHGYCLLSNHYHLLLQTPEPNLSRTMQWISTSYVQYFNTKRKRSGHLFQARFKAVLVDADEYLSHLSRYIHLNPLKAKTIESLGDYKWSSYRAYVGDATKPGWLETSWLLSRFGKTTRERQRNYREFVEGVDAKKIQDPGSNAVSGFILGGSDFVDRIKGTFLTGRNDEAGVPQLKKLKPRVSPETIVEKVSREFKIDADSITAKGRKHNVARDIAIYLAKDNCGVPFKDLGVFFGNATGQAITMAYSRIAKEIQKNKSVKRKVTNVKGQILKI